MNQLDYAQLILFIVLLCVLTPPVGHYMARIFTDAEFWPRRAFRPIENCFYRLSGIDPKHDMTWRQYARALMWFNVIGLIVVFTVQMLQAHLPFNPQKLPAVTWDLALNTAVSFVTNTNWQSYSGETALSAFTQMFALTVQNFVSAAVGLTVAIAIMRGVAQRAQLTLGNFWADLVRGTLYILLPLSVVFAIVLISRGTPQTLEPNVHVTTLEGPEQVIPVGPVASQEAIKMIGTNGGGYFNANSAHPYENPDPLVNFLQMLMIFLIPAALTYTFGSITGARKHAWVIFATMLILFITITALSLMSEYGAGGLMEGKETRFGVFNSVLFSTVTTSASCGAVNAMHSSLSPLSGGLAMLNMMLGEVIFGGVGAGFYGMMLFILLTVFIAGLMVGRTPEYLGKKIEAREMQMVILAVLAPCAVILLGTAIAAVVPAGLAGPSSKGPHGFSEILYAFTSAAANNGSAFAGLNANTPFYNLMMAFTMWVGRFAIILPILAVAGSLSAKNISPQSKGTFPVDTALFSALLIGIILIVGALTFVPALALGPIVEHLLMKQGTFF